MSRKSRENDSNERRLRLREAVSGCSYEQLQGLLQISKEDLRLAYYVRGDVLEACSNKLHRACRDSLMGFAGICVAPIAAALTGIDLPGSVSWGLGLGAVACLGYVVCNGLACASLENEADEVVLERHETVDTLEKMLGYQDSWRENCMRK